MINSLTGTTTQSTVEGSTDGSKNANTMFNKNPLIIEIYIATFSLPTDWK